MSSASFLDRPENQHGTTNCLVRASGALGQAGDGGDQDRAEYKAHDGHGGKDKTLPAGQAFAFGIVEERGEFLVDLDHWQEPGEAGAEAPDKSMFLVTHPFHRLLQIESPENRDDEHPIENPEGVGADTKAGDILNGARQNVGRSRFCLAFPHAAYPDSHN